MQESIFYYYYLCTLLSFFNRGDKLVTTGLLINLFIFFGSVKSWDRNYFHHESAGPSIINIIMLIFLFIFCKTKRSILTWFIIHFTVQWSTYNIASIYRYSYFHHSCWIDDRYIHLYTCIDRIVESSINTTNWLLSENRINFFNYSKLSCLAPNRLYDDVDEQN